MKINIGRYLKWYGVYELANFLKRIGVSEHQCEKLGDWLAETWVATLLQYIYAKRTRTIKIQIEHHDTWSMDSTLAMIIHPMLMQLQKQKQGSPKVADEDVPEHLKSINAPPSDAEDYGIDGLFHQRWEYVISEMIWGFEQLLPHNEDAQYIYLPSGKLDIPAMQIFSNRLDNSFRLFGKYYRGLWS